MSGRDIEAIYPLSPSQQGMLYECLAAPESGIHVEQVACVIEGDLDATALASAWQDVVDRHAVLRTGFIWRDQPEPMQFVRRNLRVPFLQEEWHGDDAFVAFLEEDRRRGLALGQPPLMRAALFRASDGRHHFVWTFHHIVMDGWCVPILVAELQQSYAARRAGAAPAWRPVRPFRDYIAWLRRQDRGAAERFWHVRLAGFAAPSAVGGAPGSVAADERYGRCAAALSAETSEKLRSFARSRHLTINALLQGAWALVLAARTDRRDIVFGATASGRPTALSGVEDMVGPFFNTIPVRVAIDPALSAIDWLTRLQQAQIEQQPFEYCSSGEIHQWSDLGGGFALYDNVLVFENQPRDTAAAAAGALAIREPTSHGARTGLTLSLLAGDGAVLEFSGVYDRARLDADDARDLLDGLVARLRLIVAKPEASLGAIIEEAPALPSATAPAAERPAYLAPRTVLELELAAIWERLLGVRLIGVRDNFFALGGHSLIVIKLVKEIESRFGATPPLAAIFEGPTIERLALALARAERRPFSPLVAIKPEGAKHPLFCIHPLGGNVICYADLARHLPADRPVYGLQAPGMGEGETPYADFEAMAKGYLAEIRAVQPRGPYYLAGYSFGGLVAHVVARQLEAAGERVALLAMLDTPNPHTIADEVKYTDSAGLLVSVFFALDLSLEKLRAMGDERTQLAFVLDAAQRAELVPPNGTLAEAERYFALCKTNHRMPFPTDRYDGPIVLLRGEEGAQRLTDDPALGWSRLAASVNVIWVPGSHETMLSPPHAPAIAAALAQVLQDA
ncbi:MAG TPA: alpha/beta fold hydrolase [Stellaceae bacterium]|jgi:thioesterase domain-containing protein